MKVINPETGDSPDRVATISWKSPQTWDDMPVLFSSKTSHESGGRNFNLSFYTNQ